jgi:hypothetical protein
MSLRRASAAGLVILAVAFGTSGVLGQSPGAARPKDARPYTAPKTPWGDPDLQGIYTNKDENGIPLQKPDGLGAQSLDDVDDDELRDLIRERNERAERSAAGIGGAETGAGPTHWYEHYGAKNSRAWLIVDPADGRTPPLTAEAQKRAQDRAAARKGRGPADSWTDRSMYDRCISRGLPGSMMPAIYGNSYEITQAPGIVAIRYEMIHETRIIPLDGRAAPPKSLRSFMGFARGRFEGDTLVVETTNFDPRTSYQNSNAETLKIVERFKPVAPDKVEWTVRFDDPTTWTKPWAFAMNLTKDESQGVFEYACHEGNLGLRNILSGARADEAAAQKAR